MRLMHHQLLEAFGAFASEQHLPHATSGDFAEQLVPAERNAHEKEFEPIVVRDVFPTFDTAYQVSTLSLYPDLSKTNATAVVTTVSPESSAAPKPT